MYFYRARYYDPKVGRFVTKDPIGFEGGDVNLYAYVDSVGKFWAMQTNLYQYTLNNPVNKKDPKGLYIEEDFNGGASDRDIWEMNTQIQLEWEQWLQGMNHYNCMLGLNFYCELTCEAMGIPFWKCISGCEGLVHAICPSSPCEDEKK
jgi:RHS repeat-associated protein